MTAHIVNSIFKNLYFASYMVTPRLEVLFCAIQPYLGLPASLGPPQHNKRSDHKLVTYHCSTVLYQYLQGFSGFSPMHFNNDKKM